MLNDEHADWHEPLRKYLYPHLHPFLELFGGYGVGTVSDTQLVCVLGTDEEVIEKELAEVGFVRNPISAYKTHPDSRESEGSWVLLAADDPCNRLDDGRQLHITLLPRNDGQPGREVFAHDEYDWRKHPLKHLREEHFRARDGVQHAKHIIDEHTYFSL